MKVYKDVEVIAWMREIYIVPEGYSKEQICKHIENNDPINTKFIGKSMRHPDFKGDVEIFDANDVTIYDSRDLSSN